jgi:peptidoglycan hydrolase-like protein with peptidoglycan-binding domain
MDKYYDYSDSATGGDIPEVIKTPTLGSRVLKNGSEGDDVKQMQAGLIRLGYDLGRWGADGDFGDQTEMAVKQFQKDHGLEASGRFDAKALTAFESALVALDAPVENPGTVKIEGGNCYIRAASNTSGKDLGVAHRGDTYPYAGETAENGWLKIVYKDGTAWVSGKYGRLTR